MMQFLDSPGSAMLHVTPEVDVFGVADDFNIYGIPSEPMFHPSDATQLPEVSHLENDGAHVNTVLEQQHVQDEQHDLANFYDDMGLDLQLKCFADMDALWEMPATPPATPPSGASVAKTTDGVECSQNPMDVQSRTEEEQVSPFTGCIDGHETGSSGDGETSKETQAEAQERKEIDTRGLESNYWDDETPSPNSEWNLLQLTISLNFQSECSKRQLRALISQPPRPEASSTLEIRHRSTRKPSSNLEAPVDLTGHPCARGCRECLNLGISCSLLSDEESWPCHACTEDNNECELITAPAVKRACERCKRMKISCSFKSMRDQGEACQHCMKVGYHCVAGPVKGYIRPRLRYEWDWSNDEARRNKVLRLLKDPTASEGRQHEDDFVSGYLSSQGDRKNKKHRMLEDGGDSVGKSKKVRIDDGAQASTCQPPSTKTITTKLCHPIKFNHVDTTGGSEQCHFCVEPSYAILGLGAKEVKVRQMKDGRGLEELSGGHRADGVDNTRVCAFCTLQRMHIITCSKHEIAGIPGSNADPDDNAALSELFTDTAKSARKWCSLCPSLAKYRCCTSTEGSNCSLLLCENDMLLLAGSHDGDLQKMLREIKDARSKERALGLRADYELLRDDGLLMRYVLSSSHQ